MAISKRMVVAQLVCDEASVAMQEQIFFARRGGWGHARGKRPSVSVSASLC